MNNDTPYVLRMEMIKLAQQRASERYFQNWNNAAEKARINESAQYLTEVPEYPSADDIIAEAKRFKSFVDKGI